MNIDEIPSYKLGQAPEDLHDKNPKLYRLVVAKRALVAGYETVEDDIEACITDLLADLRHLCDALDLDFSALDNRGFGHYVAEAKEMREEAKFEAEMAIVV